MTSFFKKNRFGILTAILSLLFLLFAVQRGGGLRKVGGMLKESDKPWFFAAVVCIAVYWIFDCITLHVLTKLFNKAISPLSSAKTAMIGLLYNALTPFAVGGQPMQIYLMTKSNVTPGDSASVITIKSIVYQVCVIGYAAVATFAASSFFYGRVKNFSFYVAAGFICNLVFVGIILLICFNAKFTKKSALLIIAALAKIKLLKNRKKTSVGTLRQIDIFKKSISRFKNKKSAVALSLLLTLIQLAFFFIIPYCIYRGFRLSDAHVSHIFFANTLINMIIAFVPLPGGSVAAEGSFYLFFELFFPKAFVFPSVLIWRFITYYLCILAGLVISVAGVAKKHKD